MGKRMMVTGGMGSIGSNFVRYMPKAHADAEIIDLGKLTHADDPANLAEVEERMTFVEDRKGHVARLVIDLSKLRKANGWRPAHMFDRVMHQTVRWYQERPDWWKPIRNGEFRE